MIARPKVHDWFEQPELLTIPTQPGALVIECTLSDPPSMRGRTVHVWFDGEEIALLVRAARSAAIRQRSTPMTPQ